MKVARSIALAVALCLLAAGCSSGKTSTPTSPTGSEPAAAGSSAGASSQSGAAVNSPSSTSASSQSSAGASTPTCNQLTTAEVQPLIADPISKVVVAPLTNERLTSSITSGKKVEGQTCTYATSDVSQALTISVLGGSDASVMFNADTQSLGTPASVPGVGDKAVRDAGDATSMVSSLKGDLYCSVTPQTDLIPGLAALMHAAGDSSNIGDSNYAIASAAVATLCNRIYGSGNTTPDLSGLSKAPASTSTGGALPTSFSFPSDAPLTS